jgi:hypothetical protein
MQMKKVTRLITTKGRQPYNDTHIKPKKKRKDKIMGRKNVKQRVQISGREKHYGNTLCKAPPQPTPQSLTLLIRHGEFVVLAVPSDVPLRDSHFECLKDMFCLLSSHTSVRSASSKY